MRLTWKKQPSESGLAGVCQSPRGAILSVDGQEVARISAYNCGYRNWTQWYWVARADTPTIPLVNTCQEPVASIGEAKCACEAYVRRCLGMPEKRR